MASSVTLPSSVESLIQQIVEEQALSQPLTPARRELAALGEEESLHLLDWIRRIKIRQTLDGLIIHLARKNRSSSPANQPPRSLECSTNRPSPVSTRRTEVPTLPEAVEDLIRCICEEQTQPQLSLRSRKELEHLGEEESLKLLREIRGRKITKSFDGYVLYLVNNKRDSLAGSPSQSPSVGRESIFSSPSFPSASSGSLSGGVSAIDEISSTMSKNLNFSTTPNKFNVTATENEIYQNVEIPGSSHLKALQGLEFRKAFLILSYLGRSRIQDVVTVSEIENLGTISSMIEFEKQLWNTFGKCYCDQKDRVKYLHWDSGKRYYYHCVVDSDGSYVFKGPYVNKVATLLQKVLGDENVLIVKFTNAETNTSHREIGSFNSSAGLKNIYEKGISVGFRCFRFFVFKDGGKEKGSTSSGGGVKCYFVDVEAFSWFQKRGSSYLDIRSMHTARCLFMHVHNVSSLSSYMARLSLIVSKTITLDLNLDDPDVQIEDINDIPCLNEDGSNVYGSDGKAQIHSDGTGFISEELALRCPQNCYQGSVLPDGHFEQCLDALKSGNASSRTDPLKLDRLEPPLLIQFRMFHNGRAVKGTVLINKKLRGKKIQIRPSMIKVERDHNMYDTPTVNSFEIVSTSNRPKKPRLSRILIALLNYGGVPRSFFRNLLECAFAEALDVSHDKRAALRVALAHGDLDDNYTVARMILSGIPLDETYIQSRLPILANEEKKSLKEGRLPISDSFYVMGTTDPTGSLNCDEVCILHENGQISGNVLVYRHPGIHFGDVHILKATYVKDMEEFVGNSKYGIFFPTKGPRSLADEMGGGDFDGDLYWVSRNPVLLENFKPSEPWIPTYTPPATINKKPSEYPAEELEYKLFDLFLTTRFHPSYATSQAAHSWLVYMDKMLALGDEFSDEKRPLKDKMLKLVDLYYEALDAPKKGRTIVVPPHLIPKHYPHFMDRGESSSYISESILGELFDRVDELKLESPQVQVSKLRCFDISIPLRSHVSWQDHYESYRSEMTEVLRTSGNESKNDAARDVIQKYKLILYEADELDQSPRTWEEIRSDALAIYHAVYNFAIKQRQASKCGFAWKVAGLALMRIFIEEQPEKPISCLPSVLKEVFG